MISVDFFNAKNNSLSCKINGIALHSSYNPENEGKKFVDNLPSPSFFPEYILIIEPGISYALMPLKERFPDSKIVAIRFSEEFKKFDAGFDKVFYYFNKTEEQLQKEIDLYFGEEGILHSLFFQWTPSASIFKEQSDELWRIIKKSINFSQTVLNTKGFFSKRWLKNSFNFFAYLKKHSSLSKGNCDIVIAASGPSLKNTLPSIKKERNNFYLICVSSALKALITAGIIPDLVISTDGGFYAKPHLYTLLKNKGIPVALPTEGNCSKKILSQNTVIPLLYSDGCGSELLKNSGINYLKAQRNGTVSGTAAELALELTSENVYFCGLDLASAKGMQHTGPNELEIPKSIKDNFLTSKETRQCRSRYNSGSLKVYENWFANHNFSERIYRTSENYCFSNKLGNIKDINFSEIVFSKNRNFPELINSTENNITREQIKKKFKKLSEKEEFLKECFPIEYLTWSRTIDENEKKLKGEELKKNAKAFINSL